MKIVIAGAGIAGPAAAFWLAKQGHECIVIERFPFLREAGLQVDLRNQAIEVVRRMDLLEAVRVRSVQEMGTMLVDSKGREKVVQRRNHLEQEKGQGMTSAYEILRRDLITVLYEATKDVATYRFGLSVSHYKNEEDNKVTITLSDGSTETCDLLIAADGQGSRIRKQMFLYSPDEDHSRWLGIFSAYYTLPRRDYDTGFARMYHATGRRCAMTRWHSRETGQVYLMAMTKQEKFRRALDRDIGNQKDAFLSVFKGMGWQEERLLNALEDAGDFYADEMLQRKSTVWSKGRVVLLGDSAYCASPIVGVGSSMALIGAYVLAGELAIYGDHDVEAALASYDRVLRPLATVAQRLPQSSVQNWLPMTTWGVKSLHAVEWMKNASRTFGFQPWTKDTARDEWELPDYPEMCWRRSCSTATSIVSPPASSWSGHSRTTVACTTDDIWLPSHGPRGGLKVVANEVERPSTVGLAV